MLERGAQCTENQQQGQNGFEDQRALMRWLQDSADGLSLNKNSLILFGHDVGDWSPCYHLLQLSHNVALEEPLFAAAIMQSGFCGDIQDAWRASQSDELFEPVRRDCRGSGGAFVACFSAPSVADIVSLAGDILAYRSHWARPFFHYRAAPQATVAAVNVNRICGVCALGSHNNFWPWEVF